MKKCPVVSCSCKIEDKMYVCSYHWRKIPSDIKNAMSDIFSQLTDEQISYSVFRERTRDLMKDSGLHLDNSTEVATAVRPCRYCGVILVAGLEECEGGPNVIIGGKKLLAIGKPAIYTRFKMHCCEGLAKQLANVRCENGQPAQTRTARSEN